MLPTAPPAAFGAQAASPHGPKAPARFGWGALVGAFVAGGLMAAVAVATAMVLLGSVLPDNLAGSYAPVEGDAEVPEVGDCLEPSPARAALHTTDDVIDCDELHGAEVIGVVEAPESKVPPGDATWRAFVDGVCPVAFLGYVGIDDDGSDITWSARVPSDEGWKGGDRQVFCLIDSLDHREGYGSARAPD